LLKILKVTSNLHNFGKKEKTSTMPPVCTRGALIVFEGCDRSGKTTTCQRLVKFLAENLKGPAVTDGSAAKFMRFPDRSTKIGAVIGKFVSIKYVTNSFVMSGNFKNVLKD
jgi:adenylylsulfate kinase-like enzyme